MAGIARIAACFACLVTLSVQRFSVSADVPRLLSSAASVVETRAAGKPSLSARAASDALARFAAEYGHLAETADAARRRYKASVSAIESLQKARKPITGQLIRAYEEAAGLVKVAMASAEAAQLKSQADFGPSRRLLPLATACVSSVAVGESLSKGGSTSTTPKRYAYTLCPFSNVTQREVLPDEWLRAEDKAKGLSRDTAGDGTGEVSVGVDGTLERKDKAQAVAAANRSLGHPVVLGTWQGWVPHSSLLSHFTSGSSSAYGFPPQRSVGRDDEAEGHVGQGLPRGSDGTDGAMYFEGLDTCASETMRARRRTWVLLTCGEAFTAAAVQADAQRPEGFSGLGLRHASSYGWGKSDPPSGSDPRNGSAGSLHPSLADYGYGSEQAAELPEGGDGLAGPSLTERMLQAMHPDVPSRFIPRAFNAVPARGNASASGAAAVGRADGVDVRAMGLKVEGPAGAQVLHVAEDGLCTYVVWLGTQAACTRRVASRLRSLALEEKAA